MTEMSDNGIFAAVLCAFAALMIVGTMAIDDDQAELNHYCEMVEAGAWPDYREVYDEECSTLERF